MTAAGAVCPDEPRFAVKQVVIVVAAIVLLQ